jgi:ribonuclease J
MKLLMHLTQPQFFIPLHGELRQLHQHALLAQQIGIPEKNIAIILNGQGVEFCDGKMKLGERVPASLCICKRIRLWSMSARMSCTTVKSFPKKV